MVFSFPAQRAARADVDAVAAANAGGGVNWFALACIIAYLDANGAIVAANAALHAAAGVWHNTSELDGLSF